LSVFSELAHCTKIGKLHKIHIPLKSATFTGDV